MLKKTRSIVKNCKIKLYNMLTAFIIFLSMPTAVFADPSTGTTAGISTTNARDVFDSSMDAVGWIFIAIGFITIVTGIYHYVMGMKEQQPQQRDEGGRGIAAGAVVILIGIALPPMLKSIITF
ncbi:MAG: hypothetical protein Q4D26_12400 [Clostridia bacterium]|nr:hypothetical protein [Clostridia bacterium]